MNCREGRLFFLKAAIGQLFRPVVVVNQTGLMRSKFMILAFFVACSFGSFGQPCLQPGALVSVFNTKKGDFEYLVFKFIAPYQSKGSVASGDAHYFGSTSKQGSSFHKITFQQVSNFCSDKWILKLPQDKIIDVKTPEMANGTVTYHFQLAPGASIAAHTAYRHQIYYFVKLRIH
jgi:hypothetical protein